MLSVLWPHDFILVSHLSPICLPLVSQLSPSKLSMLSVLWPHDFRLVSHLSPTCLPVSSGRGQEHKPGDKLKIIRPEHAPL